MGHTRLGTIPKTRNWNNLIQLIVEPGSDGQAIPASSNIKTLSTEAIKATQGYLEIAAKDPGLQYTFYMLAKVALASKSKEWLDNLQNLGLELKQGDSVFEFVSEFQKTVDDYLRSNGYASDISEIAQQSAGEALTYFIAPQSITLFGAGTDELRLATKSIATKKGFSQLGQKFFGTFMAKFLNFYLSRVTSSQVGQSNISDIGEITRFNGALQLHCEQSAKIVHDFSGQWYSKTEYEEGINLHNTSGFVAIALKKLRAELGQQEGNL